MNCLNTMAAGINVNKVPDTLIYNGYVKGNTYWTASITCNVSVTVRGAGGKGGNAGSNAGSAKGGSGGGGGGGSVNTTTLSITKGNNYNVYLTQIGYIQFHNTVAYNGGNGGNGGME